MYTATRNRPSTSAPNDGSRTMTITNNPTREEEGDSDQDAPEASHIVGALILRGAPRQTQRRRQRVVWDDGVVDNEGCGRKKSKICCIYHKPRRFDESSSESGSDSDSEGDVCGHDHDHPHPAPDVNQAHPASSSSGLGLEEEAKPNAYERQPNSHSNKGKGKRKAEMPAA